ncbi:RNA-directed RNA polymerase [Mycena maculata]|uniref:RNA-directed RNA polymerase n=1 Tax=Mycena maculata TaxID=230809 RepID=A0AAD7J1E7_9AGAR|nr:RNA-directed RNA polymerase [Mycena maculata]
MAPITLRATPTKDDDSWIFSVPQDALRPPRNAKEPLVFGKFIKFTATAITFEMLRLPDNRILQSDDRSRFILLSFGDLRFPETPIKATGEYISRLLKAGLFLNRIQYRFYHHSNSQLRSRSCFLREANSDAELDDRIYRLGDFQRLMSAAKRAKRIGLLFSEAQVDYNLDPIFVKDIEDIKSGDELFSDGCGLMSKWLAIQLAKKKKIIFRGVRYTPCVFQIRYLGYKGVLMLHPQLDAERASGQNYLVHFRQSMKKFSTTQNTTFSVVGHSCPYSFGRLNNDIIVLLSSLGITDEKLLAKQEAYFKWITDAATDPVAAVDFLSSMNEYSIAERVLLDGLDDPKVNSTVRSLQMKEINSFKNDRNKDRSRMIVQKSRLIFGVCDPFGVLKEGEVHIRITTARKGASTPIHADVLVVRNPCLHPGDCLKLRAVYRPELSHLVDCIVFAGVAKPGHKAAPSMSSGGDLDGDKYFVCWDPDLVPSTISESYDYPPNKEPVAKSVTRTDLANHFASYNSAGLARVAALHARWVRGTPAGALSAECQELNALHSQSVDGAGIKIPERLAEPPAPPDGENAFIINKLASAAKDFTSKFAQSNPSTLSVPPDDPNAGKQLLVRFLQSTQNSLSEFELFTLAFNWSRKLGMLRDEFLPYLAHIDFGALTSAQKYSISTALDLKEEDEEYAFVWNSLIRSDILTPRDLYERSLNQPFSLQRLYSSKANGLSTFFFYLRMATNEFTRKLLILKTDDRFAVGIFMRGELPWDEDPEVNENVVVCSFMDKTSSNFSSYRPCTSGYRLHCSDTNFQLYDKNRANTFIFMTRPPAASGAELAVSIAVQKISARVQKQVGRVNRTPVTAIELHVVSNRDRMAHQLFDMWFEHVPTETRVKRFERQAAPYHLNDIKDISKDDWEDSQKYPPWIQAAFHPRLPVNDFRRHLEELNPLQRDSTMEFSIQYHLEEETFWIFDDIISTLPLRRADVTKWMDTYPPLVFSLLKAYPPLDNSLPDETSALATTILHNLIRSANELRVAVLVALEKISVSIAALPMATYFDLLWLTAGSVRSQELAQEVLLVLNDCRLHGDNSDAAKKYGEKHALAIAFDRAEEAFEECPCDENGKPRRQRISPIHTRLSYVEGEALCVKAPIRIDAKTAVRLHSHVRLQAASKPDNRWIESIILDGVVVQSMKGELKIELMHPPPPEMAIMDWNLYNAGSTATSKAMMEALLRLLEDREGSCRYYSIITGTEPESATTLASTANDISVPEDYPDLNLSQVTAVESTNNPLSLVWGPPGTGKTTVVVQMLKRLIRASSEETKILMTASTHNAVDNVLERFIAMNAKEKLLSEQKILRVATDISKVNKGLQSFTIDARVGGDMNENNKLFKKAQERLQAATIVFTTCAGAGLGILRKADFDIALIDEASQITEPCALIPLVKGTRQAILVGDHVQLRPTVKSMGKALEFDVSLLERLYTGANAPGLVKTMLDASSIFLGGPSLTIQYRFPEELAEFPSREFYENRLRTGVEDSAKVLQVLTRCKFPWPRHPTTNAVRPTVFLQCSEEEDMGGRSKANKGQVEVVKRILPMLELENCADESGQQALSITVLSPYSKQVQELRRIKPESFTIDSFQGRESDIIIFSSVRSNVEKDIGFVDDARRLNVMWTRARLALIIIGDRSTMAENLLWRRALDACEEVVLPPIEG